MESQDARMITQLTSVPDNIHLFIWYNKYDVECMQHTVVQKLPVPHLSAH